MPEQITVTITFTLSELSYLIEALNDSNTLVTQFSDDQSHIAKVLLENNALKNKLVGAHCDN